MFQLKVTDALLAFNILAIVEKFSWFVGWLREWVLVGLTPWRGAALPVLWPHWAGTGLKKYFELKRPILFFFVEHTSVIKKSFKTEKLNGGFLRKLKKSPKNGLFLRF